MRSVVALFVGDMVWFKSSFDSCSPRIPQIGASNALSYTCANLGCLVYGGYCLVFCLLLYFLSLNSPPPPTPNRFSYVSPRRSVESGMETAHWFYVLSPINTISSCATYPLLWLCPTVDTHLRSFDDRCWRGSQTRLRARKPIATTARSNLSHSLLWGVFTYSLSPQLTWDTRQEHIECCILGVHCRHLPDSRRWSPHAVERKDAIRPHCTRRSTRQEW